LISFSDKDLLNGAEAWQSSTYVHVGSLLTADKAIDGDTNNNANQNVCAHTNNPGSYWAVAFGTYGPVKKVKIYLRSDGFCKIIC
jgi:PBP1b-binding outer membrane lipoprotein LpoB